MSADDRSSILFQELAADPAGLGYAPLEAAGSHNAIADLLNRPQFDALGKVEITPALIWIAKWGIMARLRQAAAGQDPQLASIAEVAILLVNNPNISAIDFGISDVRTMLGALSAAGIIPAEAYAEILATATHKQSRGQQLGLGTITADDVSRALAQEIPG